MSKVQIQRLKALADQREFMQGTKLYRLLKSLADTHYAVDKNYQELLQAIVNFEGNIELMSDGKRQEFIAYFRELSRLLHNYLSGTFSLIRHTSKLAIDLKCSDLSKEYGKKIGDLNSNDCVFFIKDLRNFVQHVGLPELAGQFTYEKAKTPNVTQRVLFDKTELLKWKEWKAGSKRYITTNQEIDLKIVINQYQLLINQFHNWFIKKIISQYSKEFEEFAKIDKEISELNSVIMKTQSK